MIGALFVDGGNASFALKRKGDVLPERIDYGKLARYVERAVSADLGKKVQFPFKCYYGGYRDQTDLVRRKPFSDSLKRDGWSVFDLQAKYIANEDYWKDDQVDMALALDAYDLVMKGQLDCFALLTHDSDFAALFRRIRGTVGKYVVGWPEWMSAELTDLAKLIPLDAAMKEVSYERS